MSLGELPLPSFKGGSKIEKSKSFSEQLGSRSLPKMLRLEATLLLWIAVGAFEVTLGSKYYDTSYPGPSYLGPSHPGPSYSGPSHPGPSYPGPVSPCSPGTPCAQDQALYHPKPQIRRPVNRARTVKYSYKKSSLRDPCVDSFVSTFKEAVRSSQLLCDLFDFFDHIPATEFCNGKYPEIMDALTSIGAPNPEFASQQAVEAISESFDVLTSDIVINVYSYSIAKYLFTQGYLKPQNAVQLAKQYAATMEEAASCNDSQYTTLKEGFVGFLASLGMFNADQALLIALQYGNEWKLAARPRRG